MTGAEAPPPPPKPRYNIDTLMDGAVIALGGLAMLIACVALLRHEQRSPAFLGFSLGAGVLLMAYLQWIALIICGTILLVAIISHLGDILPG